MQKLMLIFAIVLALPQRTEAQEANALRKGLRVEVTPSRGKTQTGRIVAVRNDSLFYAPSSVSPRAIRDSDASAVAFADVKSLRVSRGRNGFKGALLNSLIGTGIGILGGAAFGLLVFRDSEGCTMFCGPSFHAFAGGVIGGAFGLVGGVIHGAAQGGERWETVSLPDR